MISKSFYVNLYNYLLKNKLDYVMIGEFRVSRKSLKIVIKFAK